MSKELKVEVVDCVGVPKDDNIIKPPKTTKEHFPYMKSTGDRVFITHGEKIIAMVNLCLDENGDVLDINLKKI
jgi:hypothetical protein